MESTAFFIRISIRLYIFCLLIKNFKPSLQLLSYPYLSVWLKNILECLWYFSNTSKCNWKGTVSLLCQFSLVKKKKERRYKVRFFCKSLTRNLWQIEEGMGHKSLEYIQPAFDCRNFPPLWMSSNDDGKKAHTNYRGKHIPRLIQEIILKGKKKIKGKIVVFLISELNAPGHIHFVSSCL